jgi:hypothetical protein
MHGAAEAAADDERRLDDGVAGEARQARFEIRVALTRGREVEVGDACERPDRRRQGRECGHWVQRKGWAIWGSCKCPGSLTLGTGTPLRPFPTVLTVYPHAALVNPVAAGIGAALLIAAALQQAATARRRHKEQTDADRQRRIIRKFRKL